jgi:protein-disulfide isomerase
MLFQAIKIIGKRLGAIDMTKYLTKKAFEFGMMLIGFVAFGMAQQSSADLKKDIEELKQNQQLILKELKEIKDILPKRPPEINVRDMEIDLNGTPIIGKGFTGLVMIEFSDYQCPFCGRYARETFPKIKELYVDNKKIDYAIVDAPIPDHKQAPKAAEAAHCAEDQGKFWEIHDQLMAKQEQLDKLSSYATTLNLDLPKYEECLNTNKYAKKVSAEVEMAAKLGINGVPGFILAKRDPANPSKAKGISAIRGAMPLEMFQKELDQAIASILK